MLSQLRKLNFIITKRQRKSIVLLIILLLIGMVFEILGLGLLVPVISLILDSQFLQKFPEAKLIMDFLGGISQLQFTYLFLTLIIFIYIFKALFLIVLTFRQNRFLANLTSYLSKSLYKNYILQPYKFHIERNNSSLIKNIQVEIYNVNAFCTGLINFFVEISLLFAITVTILIIEPIGAMILGLFLGLLTIIFFQFTNKKLESWGDGRQQLDKSISKLILDGLYGIKDLKVLGRTLFYIKKFDQLSDERARINSNRITLSQLPRFYLEFVMVLGLVIFIFIMFLLERETSEIISTLGVFVAATFRMIPSINKIIAALQNLKFYNASLDVLYDEMKTTVNSIEPQKQQKLDFKFIEVVVKDLSFRYKKNSPEVLKNINFSFKKGESIGFKGMSGSGKSTLIDIFIGLHLPSEGSIACDGINIHENLRGWQNNIGYVSQDIFLINDSLFRNIAFGIPDENIDIERVKKCLKMAQLLDFANTLENGLTTNVGERGIQLSGGQRQRIGIARALYHNPEILVLDEATASLDSRTELEFMNAIDDLKGEKTTIIISHSINALKNCDHVYEIKNKKLVYAKKTD